MKSHFITVRFIMSHIHHILSVLIHRMHFFHEKLMGHRVRDMGHLCPLSFVA